MDSQDKQLSVNDKLDPDKNFLNYFNSSDCLPPYISIQKLDSFFKSSNNYEGINILHFNIRSLSKHYSEFCTLLSTIGTKLTAIALSETWLNDLSQNDFPLVGYNFISNCRDSTTGGGVGIYLDCDLDYIVRKDLSLVNDVIECIFVEVKQLTNVGFIVGCVYRPPDSNVSLFNAAMYDILNVINAKKENLTFLAGDYNLDLLNFHSHPPINEFFNNLISFSFIPTAMYPTRINY